MVMQVFLMLIMAVIGVICLLYGVAVYNVHSGTASFVMWIMLGVFFLGCVVGIHFHVWDRVPIWLRRAAIVVVGLLVMVFAVVEGCIISGFSAKGEDDLDYIIVLGAQVYSSGPSNVLKYRLDAAYDYLLENEDTICIVSGGQGSNEPFSEAKGMYDYLVEKGINGERIIMEDQSLNTVQNLTNSMDYLNPETDSIGVVTNNFHVFRSIHLAKKLGYKNVCGIAADVVPFYLPNNMLREFFGVMKDFLCGNL